MRDNEHGNHTKLIRLPSARPKLVCLATVESKPLRWLWPGRLPLGKVTFLDGDPGVGKSVLALDIAARVSRGGLMPDGTRGDVDGSAGVVLFSVADGPGDTILPRLDAAGADVSRITLVRTVREPPVRNQSPWGREREATMDDIDVLEAAIESTAARLVIIDPLSDFLSLGAKHKDVAQTLAQLEALASKTGVTMLVVRCTNELANSRSRYRSPVELSVFDGHNDASKGRRLLIVSKCKLTAEKKPILAYNLEDGHNGTVRLAWQVA